MVIKKNFNQFFFVYLLSSFVLIFVFIIFFWGAENYLFKQKCEEISKITFFIQHFGGSPQNILLVVSNKMFNLNIQDVFGQAYCLMYGEFKPFVPVAESENVLMWYIAGVVCSILIMSGTIIYVQFQNDPVLYQNLVEYFLGAQSGSVIGDQHVHFPRDINYASYILTFTDIFHFH